MKKLVIVGYNPLSQKTNVILGVDKLVNYTQVEYWDVSPIIGNQGYPIRAEVPSVKNKELHTIKDFEDNVDRLDENTLVIFNMYVKSDTYVFYKLVSKTKCIIADIETGVLPTFSMSSLRKSFATRIACFFMDSHKFVKIVNRINGYFFSKKRKRLRPFDYCFYSGSKVSFCDCLIANSIKVPINSFDYQIAKDSNRIKVVDGKYILFIDEYMPYHPDFEMLGMDTIDADTYFREINSYFDLIEERYGIPVVISAHPRAEKYLNHNFYNGRDVFWGKTNVLSYYASFIITHYSTAISFPIIYKKPILFVYTDDMMRIVPSCPIIFSMANLLSCNYVNISRDKDTNVKIVDEQKYADYLYSYITNPQSMNMDNYRFVLDLLR